MKQLDRYINKLTKLNQGTTKYGKAPHKPVLLITLIEYIEKGTISENKFFITPELVALFRENWDLLVRSGNVPDFTLPFFHLKGDKIWNSYLKDSSLQEHHIKSFNQFKSIVSYGSFDNELFLLLANPEQRHIILANLLDAYFPETKQNYFNKQENTFLSKIEYEILNTNYKTQKVEDEEKQYVRNSSFKKVIPQIYNYTCAFTGMRIQDAKGYSYVDACHIIPFTESFDDCITNGIALNPTIHRLFDKGLVSVDDDFKIITSDAFEENTQSILKIKELKGKKINLPFGENYYPSKENLEWHRYNILII